MGKTKKETLPNPACLTDEQFKALIAEFKDGCTGVGTDGKYDWFGLNSHACCADFAIWIHSKGAADEPEADFVRFCGEFKTIWQRDITGWGYEKVRKFFTVLYKQLIPVMGLHMTGQFGLPCFHYTGDQWEEFINHALCGGEITPAVRMMKEEGKSMPAKIVPPARVNAVEWPTDWPNTKQAIRRENRRKQ